jgi:hypothetical protein
VWSDQKCIFDPAWIKAFEERPLMHLPHKTHNCFITTFIDPAGAGDSFTGMCSVVRMPGTGEIVIVGMAEANPQNEVELSAVIRAYMEGFRKHRVLSRLDHAVCIEANFGGPIFANMLWKVARRHQARMFEYSVHEGSSGVTTNHQNKQNAAVSARWDMHSDRIHFYKDLITLSPKPEQIQAVKSQFFKQCGALEKKFLSSGKWTYSGKKGHGTRDDMLICYLFAAYYSRVIGKKAAARNEWLLHQNAARNNFA